MKAHLVDILDKIAAKCASSSGKPIYDIPGVPSPPRRGWSIPDTQIKPFEPTFPSAGDARDHRRNSAIRCFAPPPTWAGVEAKAG